MYDTKYRDVPVTKYEPKQETRYRDVVTTKYRNVPKTVWDTVSETKYKKVPKVVYDTIEEKKYRDVEETRYREVTKYRTVSEIKWRVVPEIVYDDVTETKYRSKTVEKCHDNPKKVIVDVPIEKTRQVEHEHSNDSGDGVDSDSDFATITSQSAVPSRATHSHSTDHLSDGKGSDYDATSFEHSHSGRDSVSSITGDSSEDVHVHEETYIEYEKVKKVINE